MTITETELSVKWNSNLELFQVHLNCVNTGFSVEMKDSKSDCILTSTWAGGKTKKKAIKNYCKVIKGKILTKKTGKIYYPLPEKIVHK